MDPWAEIKALWLLLLTLAGTVVSVLGKRSLDENDEKHRVHQTRIDAILLQIRDLEQRAATKVDVAAGFDRLEAKIDEHVKENRDERHEIRDALHSLTTKVEVLVSRSAAGRKS